MTIQKIDWSVKPPLIIAAATIGSGMFALPYVVAQAGWVLTLAYFVVLGVVVVAAHAFYLKTLASEGEKRRLLGLGQKYFGAAGFWFGFIGIVVGLLLSFVIFLLLGTQFITLLFPALPHTAALLIFWLFLALPALLSNRRAAALEIVSVLSACAVILVVFLTSHLSVAFAGVPAVNLPNFFLPFGIVLFTLAGWTGVEPFYEMGGARKTAWLSLALGTVFAAALYWLFSIGVLGSTAHIAPDVLSLLGSWPVWKRDLVALLGLVAVTTVAMPISHEIRNGLENDLHWDRGASRLVLIGLPLVAVLLGFNNFLLIVGLAGGLFVSMEYLLILAVARRALPLQTPQKVALNLISLVFLAVAVYEIATIVIR